SQKFPKPEHGLGRVYISPTAEGRLLHSDIADLTQDLTGKRLALWSHLNLLDGVPKVNGSATLQLRNQALVQTALYSETNNAIESWLDFLNVTLRTSSNSVIDWQWRDHAMPFITAGQKPVQANSAILDHPLAFGMQVAIEPWSPDLKDLDGT